MANNILKEGNIINFKLDKQLVYVKRLGSGGPGEVHLFLEELTGKKYAIKKFNPIPNNDNDDAFDRFVDEIKILVDINHKNIVRIYTYYLFSELKLGYLQMEFIEGEPIDLYLSNNPDQFDSIFRMSIDAFAYLETKNILHRDIRCSNLLISNNELKLIDFGFGKKLNSKNINKNSVVLNYPVTLMPEEISVLNCEYNEATEIYFLGCLFKQLLQEKDSKYESIINKMCEPKKKDRFCSFSDIKNYLNNEYLLFEFSDEDKKIYLDFANQFTKLITKFISKRNLQMDNEIIINGLKQICLDNALESEIQNNERLINLFLANGQYYFNPKPCISVSTLSSFYYLLNNADSTKQDVILSGIRNRLNTINIEKEELPF